MPPPSAGRALDARADRTSCGAGSSRARSGRSTGRSSRRCGPPCRRVKQRGWPQQPDRPLRPGPAGKRRADAVARGRRGHADPPRDARPDRPAADARARSTPSSPTQSPRRLREGRRPAAGVAALRRADGRAAGSTPPATPTPTATRPTASASCGAGATGSSTPSTATCRSTGSPSSNSPATCCRTPTLDQRIATGFNRNHRGNAEGGIIPEEYAVEYVVDRVETTATVWLGLTAGLRPLPRPQVRPDHAEGVLPALRLLQQRPGEGQGDQVRQLAAAASRRRRASSRSSSRRSTRSCRPRRRRRDCERTTRRGAGAWEKRPRASAATGRSPTASIAHFALDDADDGAGPIDARCSAAFARTVGQAATSTASSYRRRRRRRRLRLLRQVLARGLDLSRGRQDGTILSRMTDDRPGDGYSVVLRRRQAAGQPRQALARRRHPRRDAKRRLTPNAGITSLVTYDGSRAGRRRARSTSTASRRS